MQCLCRIPSSSLGSFENASALRMKIKTNNRVKNWNSFYSANWYCGDVHKITQILAKENYSRMIIFNGK